MYLEVPTPEANDNYLNALIMLPIGNIYAIGKVIRRKIDADGNSIGRTNENAILDKHKYFVDFDDGDFS